MHSTNPDLTHEPKWRKDVRESPGTDEWEPSASYLSGGEMEVIQTPAMDDSSRPSYMLVDEGDGERSLDSVIEVSAAPVPFRPTSGPEVDWEKRGIRAPEVSEENVFGGSADPSGWKDWNNGMVTPEAVTSEEPEEPLNSQHPNHDCD